MLLAKYVLIRCIRSNYAITAHYRFPALLTLPLHHVAAMPIPFGKSVAEGGGGSMLQQQLPSWRPRAPHRQARTAVCSAPCSSGTTSCWRASHWPPVRCNTDTSTLLHSVQVQLSFRLYMFDTGAYVTPVLTTLQTVYIVISYIYIYI